MRVQRILDKGGLEVRFPVDAYRQFENRTAIADLIVEVVGRQSRASS